MQRRVCAIARASRGEADRPQRVQQYRRLRATTRAVWRDADTAVRRIAQHVQTAAPAVQRLWQRARRTLDPMRPLARRVLAQPRARVWGGNTHGPDKVLSIFERHTAAIRKGKITTPTEFGHLVTIQEAEGPIISAYEIHEGRPAEATLWIPARDRH